MVIQENIPLKNHASYKIGGPARYFAEAKTVAEIQEALDFWKQKGCPLFVLAGGNNVLFSDEGFAGLVLKIGLDSLEISVGEMRAGAGAKMSTVVDLAARNSLRGLEWAGGLPGTIGGAVFGNAGAFGGEMKDSVIEVKSLNVRDPRKIISRDNKQCAFDYRSSIFKRTGNEIILEVVVRLQKGDRAEIEKSVREHIAYRLERQPLEYPSAGSVFKNVRLEDVPARLRDGFKDVIKTDPFPVVPVAHLLSEAGLKGARKGGAMISEKHPNFIVNVADASAKDVLYLVALAKESIRKKFDIELEEEIRVIDESRGIKI
ncbi:MAG: UDP-N-acetylmuramate dehydrogenase [Patescibacteria group bacterium]|nr:UDP-N-acetylmuramate dehydrogenase [Patescibacteria group bacterium]MCL5261999.1 UDP-N-acetylmuramate dehydrogenase [Patescibacteria group bacterium]